MTAIKVYNMSGSEVGTMELNESVFGVEYKESLIHQAVVTRLANERQGTKSTLTRTEVRRCEALETKGHGPCASGFHPRAAVDKGRRRVRSQVPRLL